MFDPIKETQKRGESAAVTSILAAEEASKKRDPVRTAHLGEDRPPGCPIAAIPIRHVPERNPRTLWTGLVNGGR